MIDIKKLKFSYNRKVIFEDVDLSIKDGDKVNFVGENGTGKTTLFNLITGKISGYKGKIIIHGNKQVGYLKQDSNELGSKSIIDYLMEKNGLSQIEKEKADLELILSDQETISDSKLLEKMLIIKKEVLD
jgi:ATP-binding cassette subfamily F protein 3